MPMQQNKQPNPSFRHRPFYQLPAFWLILAIFITAGVIIVPRVLAKTSPTPEQPQAQPTATPQSDPTSPSQTNIPQTETKPAGSGDKTPVQYDGEDPNTSASLTGTLTTARFSGDKLILRVNIDQYLSSGACNLTVSDGTHTLSRSANLIPSAATSTCEGFDLSGSELANFTRPLHIAISLTSGDKSGTIEGKVE